MDEIKGINKEEFDKFTNTMWTRLKMGEQKYGVKFETANIAKEMLDEGVDLANYALMLFLKAERFQKKVNGNTNN